MTLHSSNSGQALVSLLIFSLVAILIATGAVTVTIINSISAASAALGNSTYYVAEGGIENALIRLLRDPSYTGEILAIGDGSAQVTVSGSTNKTITSVGIIGKFKRTIQVETEYNNYNLSIIGWKEIF